MLCRWFEQSGPGPGVEADCQAVGGGAGILVELVLARHDDEGRLFAPELGRFWPDQAEGAWLIGDDDWLLDEVLKPIRRRWGDSPLYALALSRECEQFPAPPAEGRQP